MSEEVNPFRAPAATEAEGAAEVAAETQEAVVVEDAETAEALAEVSEPEGEDGTEVGSFKKAEQPAKPLTVPVKRLNKVIGERNNLRESLALAEMKLAEINGQLTVYQQLDEIIADKYAANPALLKSDALFMETWETLAKTDPQLAAAAQRVQAAMKQNGVTPVTTPTAPAPEAAAETAPATDPAVARILERDAKRMFTEVLSGHDVKPAIINAAFQDVLTELSAVELADASPADIVEMTKTYLQSIGMPFEEALAPQSSKAKPNTSGRARPATPAVPADAEGEEQKAPQYKTRDELLAARDKRFKQLARESGF